MQAYLNLAQEILWSGERREDRTGTGTISKFGMKFEHDMRTGFPLLTTKEMNFRSIVSELIWFLSGSTDNNLLAELNGTKKTIWSANADADYWLPKAEFDGDLGKIYGRQWRDYGETNGTKVDQIARLVDDLIRDPFSRRHIVTAYHPYQSIYEAALPPCHTMFQCYVSSDENYLDMQMTARGLDVFLGLPYNIASYGLLLEILSHATGLEARKLIITIGDAHIYTNHIKQMEEQIARIPMRLPDLDIEVTNEGYMNLLELVTLDFPEDGADFLKSIVDTIQLIDYTHHTAIKGVMAV